MVLGKHIDFSTMKLITSFHFCRFSVQILLDIQDGFSWGALSIQDQHLSSLWMPRDNSIKVFASNFSLNGTFFPFFSFIRLGLTLYFGGLRSNFAPPHASRAHASHSYNSCIMQTTLQSIENSEKRLRRYSLSGRPFVNLIYHYWSILLHCMLASRKIELTPPKILWQVFFAFLGVSSIDCI